MISDVDKEQIISIWSIAIENKLIEKYFIILLANRSYYYSCLSHINRGIICRYYFQIMLYDSAAKFHIKLIPLRWYYKNKDPSKEPFLITSKFEAKVTPVIPEHDVLFLTSIPQAVLQDSITQHEYITNIQLYGKISDLAHKVTMKAVSERDLNIINLFKDYLKDYDKDESYINDNELKESDKKNSPLNIGNPNKKTKCKGCLKDCGTSSSISKWCSNHIRINYRSI